MVKLKLRIFVFCLFLALSFNILAKDLEITFIDVGQGDSILIQTPDDKNILVDGGGIPSWHNYSYKIGQKIVSPLLQKKKIKKLDKVVLTHGDADHLSGLIDILETYPVEEVVDTAQGGGVNTDEYIKFLEIVKERKIRYQIIKAEDNLDFGSQVRVTVLNPPRDLKYDNANDNSLVLKIIYKNFSVILAADISQIVERNIAEKHGVFLKADVLKIAHHGSKTSSCATFLNMVRPSVTIISCGRNNSFGHPHPAVLKRLKRKKIKYLITAQKGNITVISDGENFQVNTEY